MKRKAIALMSGGLDSCLAAQLIRNLGIEVVGVHFVLPVFSTDPEQNAGLKHALDTSRRLGMDCRVVVLGDEFLEVLLNPKHGYGSGFNPCTDCHALMLAKAKEIMKVEGASFVITGEVLGQRPMSQLARKLKTVEKESGLEGLLLRPLSAQHLEETIPEKEGWLDRARMLGIEGRSRRIQMDMAREMGLDDYAAPAGGCLLTDRNFSRRLREHIRHGSLVLSDFPILKTGRHFRLPDGSKLVVGRNCRENAQIEELVCDGDIHIYSREVKGPDAILRGYKCDTDILQTACSISASYCDGDGALDMVVRDQGKETFVRCLKRPRTDFEMFTV